MYGLINLMDPPLKNTFYKNLRLAIFKYDLYTVYINVFSTMNTKLNFLQTCHLHF